MAIGLGEGGSQTAPLGRAVIGGLIGATFATLVILPAIFALLQGNQTRKGVSLHPADRVDLDLRPQESAGAAALQPHHDAV
jgi:hypothetical protein